jgi:hypothetical protein
MSDLERLQARIASALIELDGLCQELGDVAGRPQRSYARSERRRLRAADPPLGFWAQRRPCGALAVGAENVDEFVLDGSEADLLEQLRRLDAWQAWDDLAAFMGNGTALTRRALCQRIYRLRQSLAVHGINPQSVVTHRHRGVRFAVPAGEGNADARSG